MRTQPQKTSYGLVEKPWDAKQSGETSDEYRERRRREGFRSVQRIAEKIKGDAK